MAKSHRFGSIAAFIVVSVLVVAPTSNAAIIYDLSSPTSYTLAQVNAAGGIQVGNLLFNQFSVVSDSSDASMNLGSADISLQGVLDLSTGDFGLKFFGGFVAGPYAYLATNILFQATAQGAMKIDDIGLVLGSHGVLPNGSLSISENIYLQNPDNYITNNASIGDAFVSYAKVVVDGGPVVFGNSSDHATFAPTSSVWVAKDVFVTGGSSGFGHLSSFYQTFSQVPSTGSPEPATAAILAFGAFVAFLRRRRAV